MDRTFAAIQEIQVDARDARGPVNPDTEKLSARDVDLAVRTAKDLTVNEGGLLDKDNPPPKLQFALVDAVHMPRPDNNPPLDERLRGVVFGPPAAVARAAVQGAEIAGVEEAAPEAVAGASKAAEADPSDSRARRIQIGSFGSLAAAQTAWEDLRDRYPGVDRYRPAYEKVTTAKGKTMVRLKVGPVADEAQARGLCDRLAIYDAWCAKAAKNAG